MRRFILTMGVFLVVWGVCFAVVIRRELKCCSAGVRAIFRLYITDIWAGIIGLLPGIWYLSDVIQRLAESYWKWPKLVFAAFVMASELLGMLSAKIRLAAWRGKYPPTPFDCALWLWVGALIGYFVLIAAIYLAELIVRVLGF